MFKKVLVAEDIDSINVGIATMLKDLNIKNVAHCQYCDDALVKFKKAQYDKEPYELLICDLSFKKSHRKDQITTGKELIKMLIAEQPDLKVIVFSVDDHPKRVKELWGTGCLNGYVDKNRWGLKNLATGIQKIYNGETYMSPAIESQFKKKKVLSVSNYDNKLLSLLADGYSQEEIEQYFKKHKISPSSRSSIEKRLKDLRVDFGAKTTIHLVMMAKNLKLI
ncbi:DNA-binding response regulator [Patiriisocius marinistellae]|nr:response regulator [Patiriisocius marinistellae]